MPDPTIDKKTIMEMIEKKQLTADEAFLLYTKGTGPQPLPQQRMNQQRETESRLAKLAEDLVKKIVAAETKVAPDSLKAEEPFEAYGIDSVMALKMASSLEEHFGKLPQTLFFEHQSIAELRDFFLENNGKELEELLGPDPSSRATEVRTAQENFPMQVPVTRKPFRLSKSGTTTRRTNHDMAIIGISGRYPQADTLADFWQNLKEGRDCITEIPADRWDYRHYFDPRKNSPGTTYSKWGGFLSQIDKFDPLFFNIAPKEAENMDPQERLFLETVWHTLEDSGYTKETLSSLTVGVFVGVMWGQYHWFGVEEFAKGSHALPGSSYASVANRVSFAFDFKGPSIALDTMCSSSLAAIHLACSAINNGDCEMAIAGGVNISIHPQKYILLSQGQFVSTDGKCRSFGEGGDGYVPGEGVGAVLLKPLDNAKANRDQIHAVIKGSALNHGGKTNGYTVPNPKSQTELIRKVMERALLDPGKIGYIETHGTGTSLGDPLEIKGLSKAFANRGTQKQYCAIGSVKSNIGHLEAAAGIAGLTKIVLQMKHKQLVPSLHSSKTNPNIDFSITPFYVQQSLEGWPQPRADRNGLLEDVPRQAGLSSFGAGGSNAHIVLEEFNEPLSTGREDSPPLSQIIVLAARDESRLRQMATNLLAFVQKITEGKDSGQTASAPRLVDIAYTLQTGRQAFDARLAFEADSMEHLILLLSSFVNDTPLPGIQHGLLASRSGISADELIGGHEGEQYIKSLIDNKNLSLLAKLWVNGVTVPWEYLQRDALPKRCSLPGYPFAGQRCWFKAGKQAVGIAQGLPGQMSPLHPLLHRNTSNFRQQKFTSEFLGTEFFLAHHKVDQQPTYPGAAYLEMACRAGELSAETPVSSLKDVIWLRRLSITDRRQEVSITLRPQKNFVEFEVCTDERKKSPLIHARGKLLYHKHSNSQEISMDIEALKKVCPTRKSGEECYNLFKAMGIDYGPSFQVIDHLLANEEEALSLLKLPSAPQSEAKLFTMHPAILDGALQTAMGIGEAPILPEKNPFLPVGVEEVVINQQTPENCYGYARLVEQQEHLKIFRILLLDQKGRILVKLNRLAVKMVNARPTAGVQNNNQEPTSGAIIDITLLRRLEQGELKADQVEQLMEKLQ